MPHCEEDHQPSLKRRKLTVRFDAAALDQWMAKKAIIPLDKAKLT